MNLCQISPSTTFNVGFACRTYEITQPPTFSCAAYLIGQIPILLIPTLLNIISKLFNGRLWSVGTFLISYVYRRMGAIRYICHNNVQLNRIHKPVIPYEINQRLYSSAEGEHTGWQRFTKLACLLGKRITIQPSSAHTDVHAR